MDPSAIQINKHNHLPSRQLLLALNDGKFPRMLIPNQKKQLNLKWKYPQKINLSFKTVGGKVANKKQLAMGKLFELISHCVYPYWCYNTKLKGPGFLIVEAANCEKLSSIININSRKLVSNPSNLFVSFLNKSKLEIFVENMYSDKANKYSIKQSIMTKMKITYLNRKQDMAVIFVMGGPTFTLIPNRNNKLNKTYKIESNKFQKLVNNNNNCDYLELNIKKRNIFTHSLKVLMSDPDYIERMKKPNTNYPTFEIFNALNNGKTPKECYFDSKPMTSFLKWNPIQKNLPKRATKGMKARHIRMYKLYFYISQILYPYWAYNTNKNGMGLIVIRGQRMYNSLNNFVDFKGNILRNIKYKLTASFLNTAQLLIFLNQFELVDNKLTAELNIAQHSYLSKERSIGILFHFEDVRTCCIAGPKDDQNQFYEYECNLFKNVMKKLTMKSCEYLEIDLNKKIVDAFTMRSIYRVSGNKTSIDDCKTEIESTNVNAKSCGYCKNIKQVMKRCSRCNKMWYCGSQCQLCHWKTHKSNCFKKNDFSL